jgi:hypothetical protein
VFRSRSEHQTEQVQKAFYISGMSGVSHSSILVCNSCNFFCIFFCTQNKYAETENIARVANMTLSIFKYTSMKLRKRILIYFS